MSRLDRLLARRGLLILGAVVVLLVAAAAVFFMVTRDEGDCCAPDAEQVRTELLDDVRPDPDCPDGEPGPDVGDGQTRLNIARAAEGCLTYSSAVVDDGEVEDRLAELRAEADVVAADRQVTYVPGAVPAALAAEDDPEKQWPLEEHHLNGGAVRDLWPDQANDGADGEADDTRVAIVDTGIDDTNPDLAGQVVEKAPWARVYEDSWLTRNVTGSGFGDHGTHVAGIVAAADDNAGVVGLTPQVRLMDVQYWDKETQGGGDLAGPSHDLGDYVRWSVDHGADVVNMSIHGEYSATLAAALEYAERAGVVVVGLAGNCGSGDGAPCNSVDEIRWPAGAGTALSVASHDLEDQRADSSSANASVDVAAPGVDIPSDCLAGDDRERTTCDKSGTSMAAPYVAATAALLKALHPDAPPAAIREAIVQTARPAEGQEKGVRNDEFGFGILEPVDAAGYLHEHPDGTGGTGDDSTGGEITADTIVGAYRTASEDEGSMQLATAGGESIPVQQVTPGPIEPQLAFSADGAFFAAVDGEHLTIADADSGRQETVDCACLGVAFDDEGRVVTAEGAVIHRFDPASAEKVDELVIETPGDGGAYDSQRVVAATADLVIVGTTFTGATDRLFLIGVADDGAVVYVGEPPGRPAGRVAVSDDGRRVAFGTRGGECQAGATISIADLENVRDSNKATVTVVDPPAGPSGNGVLTDVFFDGDALVAGWSPFSGEGSESCASSGEPSLWQTPIPSSGGPGAQSAHVPWEERTADRGFERRTSSGEALYTTPSTEASESSNVELRQLWFGPGPGGADPVQVADLVTDVVARPL